MALRTPLYETHAELGATFTEFAGYDMPVHYGSIKQEHQAVRGGVGLFDVSHMSNLWIEGPHAAATIGAVSPKDPEKLPVGKGHYTVVLRENGTILDDTFVFRVEDERYLMIPNAGMGQPVQEHLAYHATGETMIADESADWGILALQGPAARDAFDLAREDQAPPKFHRIEAMHLVGVDCLVSGTGYTGEKGFELYVPAEHVKRVWDLLMASGRSQGIRPIGLGARDTLRLEKGYCLAGHEFEGGRTPLEAGIGFTIDWDHDFLGKDALQAQKTAGHDELLGIVQEKGIPRQGYQVYAEDEKVGVVTSGTQSPQLGKGIGLAYLRGVAPGGHVQVDVRGRRQDAQVVRPPFI